ncbi:NADPH dehydrogenase NamA [Effusibacillus pohliae]|uniref:NADPH dehydrogenase NamA n=1 Tax=Effusibacillus pohliae TaxID=232270 RepID=UPI00035E663F|nr:NADPH dehydrogenase NamA [Effusibacillus pohliae]
MPSLFDPFELKGLQLKNRIMMSPMCQYQANEDGTVAEWHYVHYGSRAVGGVGLVMVEASGVENRGRITTRDVGIFSDTHIPGLRRIVDFCHTYGAKIGIQLAHAGRKSEVAEEPNVGPSAIAFSEKYRVPQELTVEEIQQIVEAFGQAARRAVQAGFDTVEIHGAHGYLIHEFLSPISNRRTDSYGGSQTNRLRFPLEVIARVKKELPPGMPLLMRVSATEYAADGYDVSDMVEMVKQFKEAGVDMIDVSSGGNLPVAPVQYPGYQLAFAEQIRKQAEIGVITVGRMESPQLAEETIRNGRADIVAVARGLLRDPHWAKTAAVALGVEMEMPGVYRMGY